MVLRKKTKTTSTVCSTMLLKKYHCPQCDKTFSGRTGVRLHYQIHTGVFSYWCERCRKGFAVKGHYSDHMAKHEGKTFPCSYCDQRFQTNQPKSSETQAPTQDLITVMWCCKICYRFSCFRFRLSYSK